MVKLIIKNLEGFKKGDRVICFKGEYFELLKNEKGTIIGPFVWYEQPHVIIEWDNFIGDGQEGFKDLIEGISIKGKRGHCWNVDERDIRVI